ncbi:hypothetical protein AAVH_43556, partial [Aphelenchoides avenae]
MVRCYGHLALLPLLFVANVNPVLASKFCPNGLPCPDGYECTSDNRCVGHNKYPVRPSLSFAVSSSPNGETTDCVCPAGHYCGVFGQCIPNGSVDCGSYYCGGSYRCGSRMTCIPNLAVDCGNGVFCERGSFCGSAGVCIPNGDNHGLTMSRQQGPREFEEDGEIWGNEWNPMLGFDAWEWESYADVSSSSNEYNPHIFGAKQSFKSPNVTHDPRHSGKSNLYGDLSSSPHKGVTEADEAVQPFKKPSKANVPAKSSKRRNESEESNSKTLTTVTPPTNNELHTIIEKQQALDMQMIELQKQSISLTEQEAELRRRLSELEAHGQKAAAQLLELHQQREALSRKEAKI